MTSGVELLLATTAPNKVRWLIPQFGERGVITRAIPLKPDIAELEHPSPRRVLADKIHAYAGYLEPQLDFWRDIYGAIGAIAIFDLLASGTPYGLGAFCDAGRVWKKGGIGDPIGIAAGHFRELSTYTEKEGHKFVMYSPGGAMVPVERNTIRWEDAVSMWGRTLLLGYSSPLLQLLGNEDWLRWSVEKGIFPRSAFVGNSIGAIKTERLLKPIAKLATVKRKDGLSMMVARGKKRWLIDGRGDMEQLRELQSLLNLTMANAPSDLVGQMATQLRKWT